MTSMETAQEAVIAELSTKLKIPADKNGINMQSFSNFDEMDFDAS